MAIEIIQDLTLQPYPAFNNSYIKFKSDINPTKADITITGSEFTNPFRLYPDPAGNFIFDFKEVAKARFFTKDFEYQFFEASESLWGRSFLGNLSTVLATIQTFGDGTDDSLVKEYNFYKGVKQVGESTTNGYLLSPQTDPLTHDLTYWEGFPFNFQIQDVDFQNEITIKNLNSGLTSDPMQAQFSSGGMAIYIDKATSNWTESNFLPLNSYLNRLEVYEEGEFKANLNLTKKENCKGIYLKWFNNDGGFSHYLFDEFYRDETKTKAGKVINTNSFANVGSLVSPSTSTGRTGGTEYRLKTTANRKQVNILKGLYTSPRIQYWTSHEPYKDGEWIDVELGSGNLKIDSKKDIQPVTVQIELPELNTLSL